MNKKVLFIDTETGGIDPNEHSLLSIGMVVWSNQGIIDTKEFFIKHNTFNITPQAIGINKINLLDFIANSSEPQLIIKHMKEFLIKNFPDGVPITLGGHNTNFDINFLKVFLNRNNEDFGTFFSHRFIDTASILKYLYYSGLVSEDVSSSDKAFKYFSIDVNGRHSALGDAVATAELFTKLVNLIKS